MNGILKGFAEKMALFAEGKINDKVDLYEHGVKTDEIMDKNPLGEKVSERIQRGLMTDGILEFGRGLWHEDREAWIQRLRDEAESLEKINREGE